MKKIFIGTIVLTLIIIALAFSWKPIKERLEGVLTTVELGNGYSVENELEQTIV